MRVLLRLASLMGLVTSMIACGGDTPVTARLSVLDQTLTNAMTIVVAEAETPVASFLVVREDAGGVPGAAIGKVALTPGVERDLALVLGRAARDGETLYAILYEDTDEAGVFQADEDPNLDPPLKDATGDVVKSTFKVTVNTSELGPEVLATNQVVVPLAPVRIQRARAPGPAFVVLHEDDAGSPGPVIGQVPIEAGIHEDLDVGIDRPLVDGEVLQVVLHTDDGDVGAFEFDGVNGKDDPWLDEDGAIVAATFVVTVPSADQPYVLARDQDLPALREVVIQQVASRVAGFVVVHEAAAGGFGDAIGYAVVGAGTSDDVTVPLDREVRDGETLYAVLHVDDGRLGVYEFDGISGLDAPVTDDADTIVSATFEVTVVPSVEVFDQAVLPVDQVEITGAVLGADGWVVIREDNGGPGDILGQASLPAGTSTTVRVTLVRPVVSGETLYATLHTDDGVAGTFEYDGNNGLDEPVEGPRGNEVVEAFTVTFAPRLTVESQYTDNSRVVRIDAVTSVGPGFVVIYDEDAGNLGSQLGHVAAPNGQSQDLFATLTRPIRQGERLFARLHRDSGIIGTFEYTGGSSADGPVDPEGEPLTLSFDVRVPELAAEDQTVDPTTEIVVGAVDSPGPGFLVVAEDLGGTPGTILAALPVGPGLSLDVIVPLSSSVTQQERLLVTLHADGGQIGVFESAIDLPSTLDGTPVRTGIAVNFTLKVDAADQTLANPNLVVIDDVIARRPGWIVVRAVDANGFFDEVLGHAAVVNGSNLAVQVPLTRRSAIDGETLVAVLHKDEDTPNFQYDSMATDPLDAEEVVSGRTFFDTFVVTLGP